MDAGAGPGVGAGLGVRVRPAADGDWAAVAALVNPYIETTTINFRTAPQTPADWSADWCRHRERYLWLVAAVADGAADERVVGVAYAGPWKPREAPMRSCRGAPPPR